MIKATRLPSGNWRTQVILKDEFGHVVKDENGKRIVKSFTAKTRAESELLACEFIGTDAAILVSEYRDRDLTVNEALDEYIEVNSNVLSPSTLRGYRMIKDTRLQVIKDVPINKLKPIDVQRAINKDRERLCGKSIKEAVALLKRVLTMQGMEINLKTVTIPRDSRIKKPLPPIEEVLAPVIGTELELPCLLAAWLSLRMSEVRGLQFRDISKDGKFITICRTRMYQDGLDIVREQTKTEKSTRTNMLPEYLYEKIKAIPHSSDTDFIIKHGYKYLHYNFSKLMKANNIQGVTFHKLRHEFATTCNDLGISSDYIQKLGGWSTPSIMKSVYTHTTQNKEVDCQIRIDKHFNSVIDNIKAAM